MVGFEVFSTFKNPVSKTIQVLLVPWKPSNDKKYQGEHAGLVTLFDVAPLGC